MEEIQEILVMEAWEMEEITKIFNYVKMICLDKRIIENKES